MWTSFCLILNSLWCWYVITDQVPNRASIIPMSLFLFLVAIGAVVLDVAKKYEVR